MKQVNDYISHWSSIFHILIWLLNQIRCQICLQRARYGGIHTVPPATLLPCSDTICLTCWWRQFWSCIILYHATRRTFCYSNKNKNDVELHQLGLLQDWVKYNSMNSIFQHVHLIWDNYLHITRIKLRHGVMRTWQLTDGSHSIYKYYKQTVMYVYGFVVSGKY